MHKKLAPRDECFWWPYLDNIPGRSYSLIVPTGTNNQLKKVAPIYFQQDKRKRAFANANTETESSLCIENWWNNLYCTIKKISFKDKTNSKELYILWNYEQCIPWESRTTTILFLYSFMVYPNNHILLETAITSHDNIMLNFHFTYIIYH